MVDARTAALVEASTRAVLAAHIEPRDDMVAERARATFDPKPLSYLLHGGKEALDKRHQFAEAMSKSSWGDKSRRYFLSHEEEYVEALRGILGVWEKMKAEKLSLEDGALMRQLLDFPGGLELHIGMWIPSLLSQGDAEQQAKWLPLSFGLKVIGTYAQTELGHGTFVRGLETTATYDPQAQEFVLHSPTLTSTKWWPGGMGKTASHAVVMARLFVAGRDHGPHAFIVQLRDLATHLPMPGIVVGDIGSKFGFGSVDNGFMRMDHVRIPRQHMLMRFAKVTPEGQYVPPPPANAKASYATMLFVRADIVKNAGGNLAKAVTIATRYAAVRRQTRAKANEPEVQVLDYQNVAASLLPLVSASYALWFMGESMMAMYHGFEADRDKGDFSALPELHALSSGLKALCTWITADGIEECRRTCGGHGYSKLSGLPTLLQNYVQNVTWEGDNSVLCLQTARFLLKALQAARKGAKPATSAAYLVDVVATAQRNKCGATCEECWRQGDVQLAALREAASLAALDAERTLQQAGGGKLQYEGPAWNSNTLVLVRLAKAHCAYVLHQTMLAKLAASASTLGPATSGVLQDMASLFFTWLVQQQGFVADLLQAGYMTGEQARALRTAGLQRLASLRPNAVALVDAFGFDDYSLNSALGRADGDVYAALLSMAQGSPLNQTQEGPAWEAVLKPAMLGKGGGAAARSRM